MSPRRAILGGIAALAAPAASLPALTADVDPIFAAIAAERRAWREAEAAMHAYDDADSALTATGLDRKPRVLIGERRVYELRDAADGADPGNGAEHAIRPIYAATHAEIDQDCDRDLRLRRDGAEAEARRRRLHAELDADTAAVAAALAPVTEAERLSDDAYARWEDEAEAMIAVAPTTIPGLLALLDRYVEHTDDTRIETNDDGLRPLLGHVRRILGEVRA